MAEPVVDLLEGEWAQVSELCAALSPTEWARPTECPGWSVQDQLAHLIGTESMLLGEPTPDVTIDPAEYQHVRNDMGRINEAWVASMADRAPIEVLSRFRETTGRRLEALRTCDQEQWDAEGVTPVGKDTYGRFMRVRTFDCWIHEQDIRDAVAFPAAKAAPRPSSPSTRSKPPSGTWWGRRRGRRPARGCRSS